jgi:RNA polymerase sigma factor (sigma-70 family)
MPAEQWRVPGEEGLLKEVESQIQINARRVAHSKRIAMDVDDVEEEIRMMVLVAIRRFAAEKGMLPPRCFLTTVIKRRAKHFSRATNLWWRAFEDIMMQAATANTDDAVESIVERVVDATPAVDETMTEAEQEEVYRALVYVLQRDLPPAAFAVLHLRIVEELHPQEIGQLTGIGRCDAYGISRTSKRVQYAKQRAWAMLSALGIERWEDVLATRPEDTGGIDA